MACHWVRTSRRCGVYDAPVRTPRSVIRQERIRWQRCRRPRPKNATDVVSEEDVDTDLDEEIDEDIDEDIDADDLDDDIDPDLPEVLDDDLTADATETATEDDDEDDEDEVPRARTRPGSDDDEDDDVNPDDIEADLDSILKDKIASGDDDDEDEEDEEEAAQAKSASEKVNAKAADEFTCNTCFLIVHPRQFGRLGSLSCPEGYDPCPSIKRVEKALKRAKKA